MKQQVVDPFVRATPRPTPPVQPASKPKTLVNTAGSLDGVMNKPKVKPYRPPAGPLYVRYQTKTTAVPTPPKTMDIKAGPAVSRQSPGPVRPVSPSVSAPEHTPVPSRPRRPTAMDVTPPGSRSGRQQPAARQLSTFSRPAPVVRHTVPGRATPQPAAPPPTAEPAGRQRQKVSTLGLLVVAAAAGLALFSVIAGQAAIAVYAVLALWRRWPSRQSFGLALVMFVAIAVTAVVASLRSITANLAVYAFLLLCVGTLSLALEVRRDARQSAS